MKGGGRIEQRFVFSPEYGAVSKRGKVSGRKNAATESMKAQGKLEWRSVYLLEFELLRNACGSRKAVAIEDS